MSDRLHRAIADRYVVERELGSGGMATVYLAEDVKHHRKVAVKVLRPELAALLGAERFLREIETTANLRHPHILPLYDSGEADGFLYYVMPFVEGESLRDRLDREKQLPLDAALKIAREVADALSYAHTQGVIHRDIKPENILFEAGHAVVADFGIARALSAAGAARLTETGMAIGTPAYMSPEQAAGQRDLDGRSDLYSLACVLYEMLGGEPPFTGPTVESVVHQHLAVEPPPITNLRPAVPTTVSGALHRALAKNPADRFNPITQFAVALPLVPSAGEPRSPPSPASTRSPLARMGWLLGGGAIALVVLAAIFLPRSRPSRGGPPTERSVAVLPFDNFSPLPDDAYFAHGITEEITSQLSRLAGLRVVSRTAVSRALASEMSLAEIGAALGVEAILEGSVRKDGDRVRITAQLIEARTNEHLWSQDFDRELADIFVIQGEVAQAIVRALHAQLTREDQALLGARPTSDVTAYNLYLRSRQLSGNRPAQNRSAIELLRQAVALDPNFAVAWSMLAWRYVWEHRLGDSTAVDSAVAIAQRALDMDPDLAVAHFAMAEAYLQLNRARDAIAKFERALDLDPEHGTSLLDGSVTYSRLGQAARSLELASRALPQYPNVPNVRYHVALPLWHLDDDRRTEAWLLLAESEGMEYDRLEHAWVMLDAMRGRSREAIDRTLRARDRYPDSWEFELLAADYLLFLGDPEPARATLERHARLTPNLGIDDGPSQRTFRSMYAFLLHQQGERARAARLFDEALTFNYAAIERGSEWYMHPKEIAAIHALRGNTAEAFDWLERTYQAGYRLHRILARDPMFASLRGDQRFQSLLTRMERDVARERERVEAQGIAARVDSMIAAGRARR